jgi:hypothetical protein
MEIFIMAIVKKATAKQGNSVIDQFKSIVAKMPKEAEKESAKLTIQLSKTKKNLDKIKSEVKKAKDKLSNLKAKKTGKKSVAANSQADKLESAYKASSEKLDILVKESIAIKNKAALAKSYVKIARQVAKFVEDLEKDLVVIEKPARVAKPSKAKVIKAEKSKLAKAKSKPKSKIEAKSKAKTKVKSVHPEEESVVQDDNFVDSLMEPLEFVEEMSHSNESTYELS